MAKLVMCKGLPGSGKSTWAKAQDATRVSKDDIRADLEKKGWVWSRENEADVLRRRDTSIIAAFELGATIVISDDTNLAPKHETALRALADKLGVDFEVKDFTGVPLLTCLARNRQREGKARVPEKVILDMAEQFLNPALLLPRDPTRRQLFLDLDGLFADFDGFIEKEFGIENNRENERPDFWDIVRGYAGRLYFDMAPLPGHTQLWEALKRFNPIILTGCPWSVATAADDKREWVAKFIDPNVPVVCVKSRNKFKYMLPGDVLLDDWPKYRDLIEGAGVKFILHNPANIPASIEAVCEALV